MSSGWQLANLEEEAAGGNLFTSFISKNDTLFEWLPADSALPLPVLWGQLSKPLWTPFPGLSPVTYGSQPCRRVRLTGGKHRGQDPMNLFLTRKVSFAPLCDLNRYYETWSLKATPLKTAKLESVWWFIKEQPNTCDLDTGVGKSSIVCRFVQDHFDHNISPTIGASFMTKTVPCGNELHKFLIWDTAGQERFHSLAPMYYRGSAAAVIVYDITKQDSFYTLKKWVKELKEHGPENIVMAIAGNKCDLSDIREVPLKDAKEYAESIGAIVVETSAKNAINIEELFQGISRQIPPLDPHENGNNGAIKLVKQTTQASRRCC
ncbi:ras-related protein Rab-31 [Aotus nancymaae]|uniref:ras-related protein Rab-31 n=1 Tax=Aotus nancymaae TaxID=37293 RepID=UPI0030FE9682